MGNKIVELVMSTGWNNGDHFWEVETDMTEEEWDAMDVGEKYKYLREDIDNFIGHYISVGIKED